MITAAGMSGMQVESRSFLRRIDWNFAITIVGLNIIGLINVFSATHGHAEVGGSDRLFWSQLFWLFIGWGVYFVVTLIDYNLVLRLSYVIYGLNLGALIAVKYYGKTALGATRWLNLGVFSYQPSESMKLALVLLLAKVMAPKSSPEGLGVKELVFPLCSLVGLPFLMTAAQPDLGPALMVFIIGSSIHDYQKDRVYTFLDPTRDPRGKGYNSIQSKIAVGSGKFIGKGFRHGTQSQLEFVPERHTDFIFSVLSEEYGFVGSMFTISLFAWLFLSGIGIASKARDKAGAILVIGVCSILFWHYFINIGMVIGLLPIVGIPLPLISYGGTNMLTTMAALGLVSSVSFRKNMF